MDATRAIRDGRYKLVLRYDGGENLAARPCRHDPRETVNLAADVEYQGIFDSMARQLADFFARYEISSQSGLRGDSFAPPQSP